MRKFLKYPLTRDFLKLLNYKKEYAVITDTRLRILATKSGGIESVSNADFYTAYSELAKKIPKGTRIHVYELHTHPSTTSVALSPMDIITETSTKTNMKRILSHFRIIIDGHGVITRSGIGIMTYPEKETTLLEVGDRFSMNYDKIAKAHLEKRLEHMGKTYSDYIADRIDDNTQKILTEQCRTRAFRTLVLASPELSFRTVRKNRLGRIHRRRGR